MKGIKHLISKHIENNLLKYIISFVLFGAGLVLGIANSFGTLTDTVLSDIRAMLENMPEAEFAAAEIFKTSFFKNLRYFFLVFISGFSVWLTPIAFIVLFSCGFSFGFTTACMTSQMGSAGFAISVVSIIMSLAVTVPICVVLTVLAINRAFGKRQNHFAKGEFAVYVFCFVVLFIVNMTVVLTDAFAIPEIIRHICALIKT